jgi:hypothetical protein
METQHVSLDQFQPLVHVRFCLPLILFHQDGTDKFVDFVFWSQFSELLWQISGVSASTGSLSADLSPYLLDHLVLL